MNKRKPAALGGKALFDPPLRLAKPSTPNAHDLVGELTQILDSGVLTNGPNVRRLEEEAAEYLGVKHCVAVSSCTSGLILLLRACLTSGEVIVPSFTFAATVHSVVWNGLTPVFADIDEQSLTLDPDSVRAATTEHTVAVLGTHIYGNPCDITGLDAAAKAADASLMFDAAHGFGATYRTKPLGRFGIGEVFSLTPTKTVVAGEGGIIATNDDEIAERCRVGRDYGNPGDYDCRFVGLSARLSEFHAALALHSLGDLDERLHRRRSLAAHLRSALEGVPGVSFPIVSSEDKSTFKDFAILIEAESYGVRAPTLARALEQDGIETRRYYSPPVHRMQAYRSIGLRPVDLEVTERIAEQVLCLPLWDEVAKEDLEQVAQTVAAIHHHAEAIAGRV